MYSSVKDSGKRQEFSTGSVRDSNAGKGRYDLLPTYALSRLAQHFQNGAEKYGDENWRKGQSLRRYLDSALRHTLKFLEGHRDEDHAIAAVWNLMALVETQHMIDLGILPIELADLPDWTLGDAVNPLGNTIGLGEDGSAGIMAVSFTGPDAFDKPTATPTSPLCEDQGCDHYGTAHVCLNNDPWPDIVRKARERTTTGREDKDTVLRKAASAIALATRWLQEN